MMHWVHAMVKNPVHGRRHESEGMEKRLAKLSSLVTSGPLRSEVADEYS